MFKNLILCIQHIATGHTWGKGWNIETQVVICECGAITPLKPWLRKHYPTNKE